MQEEGRRILKVAAPFAGVALGWYVFMPNFTYLTTAGIYQSQFLTHLLQVQEIINAAYYRFTTPKELLDHSDCRFDALLDHGEIMSATPLEEFEKVPDLDQFIFDRCGPDPHEG